MPWPGLRYYHFCNDFIGEFSATTILICSSPIHGFTLLGTDITYQLLSEQSYPPTYQKTLF